VVELLELTIFQPENVIEIGFYQAGTMECHINLLLLPRVCSSRPNAVNAAGITQSVSGRLSLREDLNLGDDRN
ncbi:MAG: hypothetical protein AAFO17_10840, partial [Pseudomonadota bacterium]